MALVTEAIKAATPSMPSIKLLNRRQEERDLPVRCPGVGCILLGRSLMLLKGMSMTLICLIQ